MALLRFSDRRSINGIFFLAGRSHYITAVFFPPLAELPQAARHSGRSDCPYPGAWHRLGAAAEFGT